MSTNHFQAFGVTFYNISLTGVELCLLPSASQVQELQAWANLAYLSYRPTPIKEKDVYVV